MSKPQAREESQSSSELEMFPRPDSAEQRELPAAWQGWTHAWEVFGSPE